MNISLAFLRSFFFVLCIFFMVLFMSSLPEGARHENMLMGIILGALLGSLLIGFDTLFRRYNLRSFNIAIVGLFIGYLMGEALLLIFNNILQISSISVHLKPQIIEMVKISLFLFGTYLGCIMTLRASDEFYISLPFVKFTHASLKKKDLIVDSSVLSDARIIDVGSTGLFDNQLIIPRFIIKELYSQAESADETSRTKAKRGLEVVKKLEETDSLGLKFSDTDFPEVKDINNKLVRLARLLEGNILTADISRVEISNIEGIKVINIHTLSNALKPIMQAGELIKIKIQRYGKEPRQGVGYLEDGTMVVVNGAGDFIGKTLDAQVLSVKHTSSGRMIFCNVAEGFIPKEGSEDDEQ